MIEQLIGKTVTKVIGLFEGSETIEIECADGSILKMAHHQDCCESVAVADVHGDIEWLIGSPIVTAEERVNSDNPEGGESSTWTFYELATNKGSVTIRWCGMSNGYYSEGVDCHFTEAPSPARKTERRR